MVVRLCASMLIALGVAVLGAEHAAAFCVYNKIAQLKGDDRIFAEITEGGSWEATIARGGSQCCSWEDPHCNPSGRRDGMLSFRIVSFQTGADSPRPCTIDIEAGGWIYVTLTRALGNVKSGDYSVHMPVTSLKCVEIRYKF